MVGTEIRIDNAALSELEHSFRGQLVRRTDPGYDESRRIWNGSISRFPALVARCAGVADVIAAVRFARDTGLPVAVRAGGHSFPGLSVCDGGIVIDLGPMKQIQCDPSAGTVRAGAGVLLGELDRVTQEFGLAVPLGSVTHTGLAGLTLGGGIGWLMRKLGLTIDQLLSVELVTVEGEVLRASEADHPELFWGVRGGGGNFGIVTEFEYRLHAVGPTVLSSLLLWPLEDGPDVLRRYRDWAASAPDDLTTAVIVRRAPPVDLIPGAVQGQPVVAVASCWSGPMDEGEHVVEPMRRFGAPIVDATGARSFVEHQAVFDPGFPHGMWVYSKAADVDNLTDDVIDVILDRATGLASPRSAITCWQLGGAVARVGDLDTAFGSRSSGYLVDVLGATDSAVGFEREVRWARASWAAFARGDGAAYVNWLMDEGEQRVRQAYGERRYRRLQALKRRYDPANVLRLNQNIRPV
jgi:FAD/FMN-containing dehydrogenase